MAVTTTASMRSIIETLRPIVPGISIVEGTTFAWLPAAQQITYNAKEFDAALLLHEVGHARRHHTGFRLDVELLRMERQAWREAQIVGQKIDRPITDAVIESHLDSYRDWLHARSKCPQCDATGLQTKTSTYTCPQCSTSWKVNDARMCQLRRRVI